MGKDESQRGDPSEYPEVHVIEVVEVERHDPGKSPVDGFARVIRDASTPVAIVARTGAGSALAGLVSEQVAALMVARPALTAVAIVARRNASAHPGVEIVPDDEATPRWPVAIALDVRRTRAALPDISEQRDDPWLWVLDQLSRSHGQIAWVSADLGPHPDVPAAATVVIPALDPSLGDVATAMPRAQPHDPGESLGVEWEPLWAAEAPSRQLVVGGPRPSAAWRMLGRVLRASADGATPLYLTASGEPCLPQTASSPAAWVPAEALPGSVALMLFDHGGDLVIDHAAEADDVRQPVAMLGWAMAPLLSAQQSGSPPPPHTVRAGSALSPVYLYACERPDTRGVFLESDGVIRGAPNPSTGPLAGGFVASQPQTGLAPIIDGGVVIGHARAATHLGLGGVITPEQSPLEPRSLARRARARVGSEIRVRRADARSVLIVLPWMTVGGADFFIRDLARDLGALGMESHVVLTYPGAESPPDNRSALRPMVRSLTCAPDDHPGEHLADVVNRIGRKHRVGTMLVCGGWQIYEALPGLRSALPGTRVVDILFNDFGHIENNRRYSPWIDVTVCAFPGLQDLLVRSHGEDPERTRTIFIGIDTSRFSPASGALRAEIRGQMGLDPNRPVWGYAGRISTEKCLPNFIHALEALGDAVPAQVVIQGDGPADADLADAIAATGVEVVRRGFQPDQLPALQAMDAYVLPSRVEGIPLAIMEAAACGAVPVASAVGGVPDLVLPGFSGYLAAPDDPGALAAALLALAGTPDWLASEMAANARAIVRRRMTWTQTVRDYAALISRG